MTKSRVREVWRAATAAVGLYLILGVGLSTASAAAEGDRLTAKALNLAAEQGCGDSTLSALELRHDSNIARDIRSEAILTVMPIEVFDAARKRYVNLVCGIYDHRIGKVATERLDNSARFKGNKFYVSWWQEPEIDFSKVVEVTVRLRGKGKFRVALEDRGEETVSKRRAAEGTPAEGCAKNCPESVPKGPQTVCKTAPPSSEQEGDTGPGRQMETLWTEIINDKCFKDYTFKIEDFRRGRSYGLTGGRIDWEHIKNVKIQMESRTHAVLEVQRITARTSSRPPEDGKCTTTASTGPFGERGGDGRTQVPEEVGRLCLEEKGQSFTEVWNYLGTYSNAMPQSQHSNCSKRACLRTADRHDELAGGGDDDVLGNGTVQLIEVDESSPYVFLENRLRPEVFIDLFHREEEARDNRKTDFTDQTATRFTGRFGFSPLPEENVEDVTAFVSLTGIQSPEDSFSFLNNVQPGVGLWVRPLRRLVGDNPLADLVADIRLIGTYSWDTYFTRDKRNRFDQDGNVVKLALDWYGETPLWRATDTRGRVSFYFDVFSEYSMAESGPKEILRWSSRSGVAGDYGWSRFRIYPRLNGVYGFSSEEPFNNNVEYGVGIAWQPLYNMQERQFRDTGIPPIGWFGREFVRSFRLFAEYVDVSYLDRHNDLFYETQPDRYFKIGIEFWGGR